MSNHQGRDKPDEGSEQKDSGTRRVAQRVKPVIVFADDSAVQTLKLQELLEEAGYRAVACSDGATAVRRTAELRPDLVLLDLEMPGMSGVEACKRIRASKAIAHIPVLILTAHSDSKKLVEAFAAGCTSYLLKGTPDAVILEKIGRHAPVQDFLVRRVE